ncbi:MAG: peptide/nickel transport system permease protein [Acidimicrobiaceae bacterium]|jgi:peptide/nickel transport system permease protein|nr:peptide/nickel transport system permease protein [Acidimicrobiaceae bacterium]MDQ1368459.1 peptide/nickel transport system permease protein [Acidimicrobiaceae bacterium]MDQ1412728.1 peptide/nickel transport system permease protein [Acidimicrobiaceae bacterium]MDQ1419495.1 peptide/nickel transport system permease protein [Acidimicrobiaceae bacterium]MDQ1441102.1 peptide/nickel transport system permease protein [Acidimicrobiaceae bacterium]
MKTRGSLTEVSSDQEKVTTAAPEVPPSEVSLAPLTQDATEPPARSQWQLFFRRFRRHRLAIASLVLLVVLYLVVSFSHLTAPYPLNPKTLSPPRGPNLTHLLGTDDLGRDQTTRMIYAAHLSMTIGLLVAIFSTLIGTFVGAVAGYFGGWIDQVLMRVTDLFLVVPALVVIAVAQQGLDQKKLPIFGKLSSSTLIIGILSILFWMYIARVVRGLFLSLKEKEFIEAARASGASSWRIMFRHILPNTIGPIVVNTTLVVAQAILLESTLSFLGLGIKPPAVSLGSMMSDAEQWVGTHNAYLIYFPGLLLLLIVLAVNFLGDGLRDAFDPQSKH